MRPRLAFGILGVALIVASAASAQSGGPYDLRRNTIERIARTNARFDITPQYPTHCETPEGPVKFTTNPRIRRGQTACKRSRGLLSGSGGDPLRDTGTGEGCAGRTPTQAGPVYGSPEVIRTSGGAWEGSDIGADSDDYSTGVLGAATKGDGVIGSSDSGNGVPLRAAPAPPSTPTGAEPSLKRVLALSYDGGKIPVAVVGTSAPSPARRWRTSTATTASSRCSSCCSSEGTSPVG